MLLPTLNVDDVCFIARRVLSMLRDHRTNADRLARLVEAVDPLADRVTDAANELLGDRGRAHSVSHAITLLGYTRLERVVRNFLYAEFERLTDETDDIPEAHPVIVRLEAAKARVRYAAV
jgi:hypothetical protein